MTPNAIDKLFITEQVSPMMNPIKMLRRLATNIRRRRLELGLTQQQLAERAGISCKYLGKLEASRLKGQVCPSVTVFAALCRSLELSPNELLEPAHAGTEARSRATRRMANRDLSAQALKVSDKPAFLLLSLVQHIIELESRTAPQPPRMEH